MSERMGLRHREPRRPGWVRFNVVRTGAPSLSEGGYRLGRVVVISSLVDAEMPDGNGTGLQWLVSVSTNGQRPKVGDVRRALADFGMRHAEEDNHERGNVRKFWLVVDPARRVDCQCKTDERLRNDRGYAYSEKL